MTKNTSKKTSGLRAVATSSAVSVVDIVFSFTVAAITGSTIMLAQGLQGFADLVTTLFLLVGVKRSDEAPSERHPLGRGKEIFFWALISSLFAFLFSGAIATFNAIRQILDASPLEDVHIAFIALAIGLTTNSFSLRVSWRRLAHSSQGMSLFAYIRKSSLIETKMTLLVDFMGSLSAALGLVALTLFVITDNPVFDGVGALIIGLLTASGALLVIIDLKDLIVGRAPLPQARNAIKRAASSQKGVESVLDLRAVTVGSGKLLVILELHFKDDLTTDEIEVITDKVKAAVMKAEPQVTQVQVEAETPD